jgi:vitamin B12 transporter
MRLVFLTLLSAMYCTCWAQRTDSLDAHGLSSVTVKRNAGQKSNISRNTGSIETLSVWKSASNFQMNQYGLGGLSTLALRGGNAEQLSVLWQGLPLNSAANGVADANLVPWNMFNQLSWNTSNSVVTGSGSISGTLTLDNTITSNDPVWYLEANLGSIGQKSLRAQWVKERKSCTQKTIVYLNHSKNEYSSGEAEIEVPAHRTHMQAMLHESHWQLRKVTWTWNVWLQNTGRIIPNGTKKPVASQNDQNVRGVLTADGKVFSGFYTLKTALFSDWIYYENSQSRESNSYRGVSWFNIAEYKKSLKEGVLLANVEWRRQTYQGDTFYNEFRNEFNTGIQYKYRMKNRPWKWNAAVRTVYTPNFNTNAPLLYAVDATRTGKIGKWTASLSENYRLPAFNQLFWRPGGDETLQPERSLQSNLQFESKDWRKVNVQIDAYSIWYRNRLIWIPGINYPTVDQVDETQWSRGLDVSSQTAFELIGRLFMSQTQISFNRTNSQGQKSSQAIFFPKWRMNQRLTTKIGKHQLGMQYNYQSKRFTDTENLNELPQIHLFDLIFQTILNERTSFQVQVNNVLNTYYYFIPNQPMPGIMVNINISKSIFK